MVADAVPIPPSSDQLRVVSKLTRKEIDIIVDGLVDGLKDAFEKHVRLLSRGLEATDKAEKVDGSKFQVFPMSCGRVKDFHAGLEGRLGAPMLNFMDAMKQEHCTKSGCRTIFTTTNYNIQTCPADEWAIVAGERDYDRLGGRCVPSVKELLKSDQARQAGLQECEIVAVVLYTGPMFQVYNTVLRRWPRPEYEALEAGGNLFATTIQVLVSAVHKIGREMRLPAGLVLYRGLGGTTRLPRFLSRADRDGPRGLVEWGFMSTTASKEVAVRYSGVREGKPCPCVLEIVTGSVDRGACIENFSQFRGEREYLWVPCSFIEAQGAESLDVTEHGVVSVVQVRVNLNLRSRTVEELLGQKKSLHLSAFRFLLEESRAELAALAASPAAAERAARDAYAFVVLGLTTRDLLGSIEGGCAEALKRHEAVPPERYLDDALYRSLVAESLDTAVMARSKFRWWLEGSNTLPFVRDRPLRRAHREYLMILERRLAASGVSADQRKEEALELCRMRGLVSSTVNERNEIQEDRLQQAAAEGAGAAALRLLVLAGADPCAWTRRRDWCAVMLASLNGHTDTVLALVQLKADVRSRTREGWTAVMSAAINGHTETVLALANLKADVHAEQEDGSTAIIKAAVNGRTETVRVLAQLGADVHARTRAGATTVMCAAQDGHTETLRVLVEELGADVNVKRANGKTAVMMAAQNGHTETVRVLHELRANVQAAADKGVTALMIAAQNGHVETVKVLHELGGDVLAVQTTGATAGILAARHGHANVLRTLHSLVTATASGPKIGVDGDEVWGVMPDGTTALMVAAKAGHTEAVRALAACCADVNGRMANGDTAALIAARSGHPDILLELAKLGADIHSVPLGGAAVDNTAISPIATAALGHMGVLRALATLGVASASSALAAAAAAATSDPSQQQQQAVGKLEQKEVAGADLAGEQPKKKARTGTNENETGVAGGGSNRELHSSGGSISMRDC